MNFDIYADALDSDTSILDRMHRLFRPASRRQFWLVFLDSDRRQCPTIIPIDGIPDLPDETDAERFAPVLEWLADGENAHSVVVLVERPGTERVTESDRAWIRTLRSASQLAEIPVRAQLVVHDDGVRLLAPDDYI